MSDLCLEGSGCLAAALEEGGLRPPGAAELAAGCGVDARELPALLAALRGEGRVVSAGELWFSAPAAARAREAAASALARGPMRVADLRDLWGVGRKQALALAAYLDSSGLTRRDGDVRVLRRGASPR